MCWLAPNIGSCWSSRFNCRFDAGRCDRDHCRRRSRCALAQCNVLFTRYLHPCIRQLLMTPASVSSSQCLGPPAEGDPVHPCGCSPGPRVPSCSFSSPLPPCHSQDFGLLCAPTAECDVDTCAVGAFFLCVVAESTLLAVHPTTLHLWSLLPCGPEQ